MRQGLLIVGVMLTLVFSFASCQKVSDTLREIVEIWALGYSVNSQQRYTYSYEDEIIIFPEALNKTVPKIPVDSLCSLVKQFPLPADMQFVFERGVMDSLPIGCWISYAGSEALDITEEDFYRVVDTLWDAHPRMFVEGILEMNLDDELDSWITAKFTLSDLLNVPADSLDPILVTNWKDIFYGMRKSLIAKIVYSAWIRYHFKVIYAPIPKIVIEVSKDTVPILAVVDYYVARKVLSPYEEELEKVFPVVPDVKNYDNGRTIYFFISPVESNLVQLLEQMRDILAQNGWQVIDFLTMPSVGTLKAVKHDMKLIGSYDFTKGQVLTFTLQKQGKNWGI
ncbi:MAG: hypothetical protein GXO48_08020 [Chlorobi bacterium]|nr:hypothetical protein [Chlorobiota bacterium]